MKMKRALTGSVAAMLLLGTFAYAEVKTDYNHSADFAQYRTFDWKLPQRSTNGIVDNALVAARIEQAVDSQLMTKGLQQVNSNADLHVIYHIGAKSERNIDYFPSFGYRRWGWWGGSTYVNRYIKGSVVIDLVDARTNQLVWRAFLTDTGSHLADVQTNKAVAKMVSKAFKSFPPKES
jgi:hypothetical protein